MDLIGKRFGMLTVTNKAEPVYISGHKTIRWHCVCDCGNEKDILQRSLRSGSSTSCGCSRKKANVKNRKQNTYDLTGSFGIGYDSNGNAFYFDLEDYDKIKEYCWISDNNGYFTAYPRGVNSIKKRIKMHRVVLDLITQNDDRIVDHINNIKCDNRKCNLRIVNNSQNRINKPPPQLNTSGHVGVSFRKDRCKWRAFIKNNGKYIHLGYFDDINDAIEARLDAEKKYYKEYSYCASQEFSQQYTEELNEIQQKQSEM